MVDVVSPICLKLSMSSFWGLMMRALSKPLKTEDCIVRS